MESKITSKTLTITLVDDEIEAMYEALGRADYGIHCGDYSQFPAANDRIRQLNENVRWAYHDFMTQPKSEEFNYP